MDEAMQKLKETQQNIEDFVVRIKNQAPPITAYDYLRSIRQIAQTVPEPANTNETPQEYIARLNTALNYIVDKCQEYERVIGKEAG